MANSLEVIGSVARDCSVNPASRTLLSRPLAVGVLTGGAASVGIGTLSALVLSVSLLWASMISLGAFLVLSPIIYLTLCHLNKKKINTLIPLISSPPSPPSPIKEFWIVEHGIKNRAARLVIERLTNWIKEEESKGINDLTEKSKELLFLGEPKEKEKPKNLSTRPISTADKFVIQLEKDWQFFEESFTDYKNGLYGAEDVLKQAQHSLEKNLQEAEAFLDNPIDIIVFEEINTDSLLSPTLVSSTLQGRFSSAQRDEFLVDEADKPAPPPSRSLFENPHRKSRTLSRSQKPAETCSERSEPAVGQTTSAPAIAMSASATLVNEAATPIIAPSMPLPAALPPEAAVFVPSTSVSTSTTPIPIISPHPTTPSSITPPSIPSPTSIPVTSMPISRRPTLAREEETKEERARAAASRLQCDEIITVARLFKETMFEPSFPDSYWNDARKKCLRNNLEFLAKELDLKLAFNGDPIHDVAEFSSALRDVRIFADSASHILELVSKKLSFDHITIEAIENPDQKKLVVELYHSIVGALKVSTPSLFTSRFYDLNLTQAIAIGLLRLFTEIPCTLIRKPDNSIRLSLGQPKEIVIPLEIDIGIPGIPLKIGSMKICAEKEVLFDISQHPFFSLKASGISIKATGCPTLSLKSMVLRESSDSIGGAILFSGWRNAIMGTTTIAERYTEKLYQFTIKKVLKTLLMDFTKIATHSHLPNEKSALKKILKKIYGFDEKQIKNVQPSDYELASREESNSHYKKFKSASEKVRSSVVESLCKFTFKNQQLLLNGTSSKAHALTELAFFLQAELIKHISKKAKLTKEEELFIAGIINQNHPGIIEALMNMLLISISGDSILLANYHTFTKLADKQANNKKHLIKGIFSI